MKIDLVTMFNKTARVIAEIERTADHLVEEGASAIQEYMVEHVRVDTGYLRDHIDIEPGPDAHTKDVVAGADYSLPLEYGSVRNRAFPFARPAVPVGKKAVEDAKKELNL